MVDTAKVGYFMLLTLILAACTPVTSNTTSQSAEQQLAGDLRQVTLDIEGMTCGSCAYGLESQLKGVDGVVSADASWVKGSCIVQYDADKTDPEMIAKASTVYPAVVVSDEQVNQ